MKTTLCKAAGVFLLLLAVASCRKDEVIPPVNPVVDPPEGQQQRGLFLLNEGQMDMNNATLDYLDYSLNAYTRNIYGLINPGATLGLGDTGNDLAVYGAKLYAVITGSHKLEIMQVANARRIKTIDIKHPRYIAFAGGKAYVTAYDGTGIDPATSYGMVVEIDTASMEITNRLLVGYRPEGLAVAGGKLYVANSVIYDAQWTPTFDKRLSVIDLATFSKVKDIDVVINMKWVKPDKYGNLYISSQGNYFDIPAALYVVNTATETVTKTFNISASNLCVSGDSVYVIGTAYDENWNPTYTYDLINAKTQSVIPGGFIKDGTEASIVTPYGIAVDPVSKSIYVTDAGDYTTPGTLYGFTPAGQKKLRHTTGVSPAHFAFVYTDRD